MLAYLSLRALRRLLIALLALPLPVTTATLATGGAAWRLAGAHYQLWLLELWPAALAFGLCDLRAALEREGSWRGAASLGWSPTALRAALLGPACLLAALGVGAQLERLPALRAHLLPAPPLTASEAPCAALPALTAALPASAAPQPAPPPDAAALLASVAAACAPGVASHPGAQRRLPWSALRGAGGVVERLRRLVEPFLGVALGAAGWLALRPRRRPRPPSRAAALLAVAGVLVIGHALWALLMLVAATGAA